MNSKLVVWLGETRLRMLELQWKITNDSMFQRQIQNSVVFSTNFCTQFQGKETCWYLKLFPSLKERFLSVRLENSSDTKIARIHLFLLDQHGDVKIEKILSGKDDWVVENFVERNFYMDHEVNSEIKILCKIIIAKPDRARENSVGLMCDDYEKLFLSKKFYDFTITSADGKKLRAHKAILAGRSPVFRAMLEHDVVENSRNNVVIEDVEYNVLFELLRFIYTGKVNDINSMASQMLTAAEKYSVDGLKLMCEETMMNQLEKSNSIDYLILADRNNAFTLKKNILDFIVENLRSLEKTVEFKSLGISHLDLLYEIISAVASKFESE